MRTLTRSLGVLIMLLGLTACNTMRGVGEDITAMGRYISSSTGTAPSHSAPPPSGTGF